MAWFDLTGDARLGRCATEGCVGQPTSRLEANGVGSNYCSGCRERISGDVMAPWSAVNNSWQYTTIYDASGRPICQLDLEDWGVTEENQSDLEEEQARVAALIVAAPALPRHREALEAIAGFGRMNLSAEWEHGLRDIIRSMTDCAKRALGEGR